MAFFNGNNSSVFARADTPNDMTLWDLSKYADATVVASTPTRFAIGFAHHLKWDFSGTDLTFDANGFLVSGTLTGFTIYDNTVNYGSAGNFTMDAADFLAFMSAKDTAGFRDAIFHGDDTIGGAYHALAGDGNDTITDCPIVEAGAGNDTINVSVFTPVVTNGVNIDAGADDDVVTFGNGTFLSEHVFGGDGTDRLVLAPNAYGGEITIAMAAFDSFVLADHGFEQLVISGNGYISGDNTDNAFDFSDLPFVAGGEPAALTVHGWSGNDTITGLADVTPNALYGETGSDSLTGGAGDDTLYGSGTLNIDTEADTMYGGGGNDTMHASGADTVDGGSGDDLVIINNVPIASIGQIVGGDGTDTLDGSAQVSGDFSALTASFEVTDNLFIQGSDAANAIDLSTMAGSTPTTEVGIDGNGGDDTLTGLSVGLTFIYGGAGNDEIVGGAGADTLYGDADNDVIHGGGGDDTIDAGTGTDTISGGAGSDTINLSDGGDVVFGDNGGDHIDASGSGASTLYGGSGNDILGGTGDETFYGGDGNDLINLSTGNDTAHGGAGDDTFFAFQDPFSSSDSIDGGAGNDSVEFSGLNGPIVLTDSMLVGIELITLLDTASFSITTADDTVAAAATLTIQPGMFTDGLNLDGSAETDGQFVVFGTSHDDTLIGGSGNDEFHAGDGTDSISGGGGDDTTWFGVYTFFADDMIAGGDGNDTIYLSSAEAGVDDVITFNSSTITGIENLVLVRSIFGSDSDHFVFNDGNVAAGETLSVDATALGVSAVVVIDATAELDGTISFVGGKAGEIFVGGQNGNVFHGGGGADDLSGGAGIDTFAYTRASDSTSTTFDTISDFDGSMDRLSFAFAVTGVDAAIDHGKLSAARFDTQIRKLVATHLQSDHAILVTATRGDLAGQTFLIVDGNGVAGYQANKDFVIALNDATNLDQLPNDFIVG